jgi:hypothetical protein
MTEGPCVHCGVITINSCAQGCGAFRHDFCKYFVFFVFLKFIMSVLKRLKKGPLSPWPPRNLPRKGWDFQAEYKYKCSIYCMFYDGHCKVQGISKVVPTKCITAKRKHTTIACSPKSGSCSLLNHSSRTTHKVN